MIVYEMKQVIGLVLLGLFCSNVVLADDDDETQTEGALQSGCIVNGVGVNIANYSIHRQLQPTSGLRLANMNIVSQASCAASWAPFPAQRVTANMICAKYSNGVDICKGDSGGAFVCDQRLSGIVSFTNPNCNSAWPAGFAKITAASIRSFIRGQTNT